MVVTPFNSLNCNIIHKLYIGDGDGVGFGVGFGVGLSFGYGLSVGVGLKD